MTWGGTPATAAGESIPRPADPARFGYAFDHWALNGESYDFSAPVTEDITLTYVDIESRKKSLETQRESLLRLLFGHLEHEVHQGAYTYLLITAFSYPFTGVMFASSALQRSMNRSQ